ncbi:type I pantothenate kinase [Sphingobacterium chuzhouense]|uniref:Pantothenate kinase n=1 Tax=Sphingobacterium chuzhouense TaxID=1742264 RepID=A0ABR7XQL7_9SPHI|nr:type I pantothenate kinase [Sphingobacterium chuzhouense]MBD1421468.1 type I pantothenate kinase [Sphingobacterium chuzhouense]
MSSTNYSEVDTPFQLFDRAEWRSLNGHFSHHLTSDDIENLRALNEPLTVTEIEEIYFPLAHLLGILIKRTKDQHAAVNNFLNRGADTLPFIVGIAGSVAAGKSTTARVLQKVLSMLPSKPKVELVTTDGFLYPNKILAERNIRKGFPESYDTKLLLNFLASMKSGISQFEVPVYSHLEYDIIPHENQIIAQPDILIVEGINVLQVNSSTGSSVFVSDYFDYSIYVDADEEDLINWYINRFESLRATSFQNPASYFHRYANLGKEESIAMATNIWNTINLPNLHKNILPTRYRADLILEKGSHHFVKQIKVRKI